MDPSLPPGAGNWSRVTCPGKQMAHSFSVLMTTFCTADRVRSAILFYIRQTYKNIELIVVDDAKH